MRLFILIATLLIAGGAFLLIDGGLKVSRALSTDTFSVALWRSDFWLLVPDSPSLGLGPNGRWFLRLAGGLVAMGVGAKVLKVAAR